MKGSPRRLLARFVVGFGLLMGLFYAASTTDVYDAYFFQPYLRFIAHVSAWLLLVVGEVGVMAFGSVVVSPKFYLAIGQGCDGIEPTAFFVALVLAFPSRLVSKLPALALGIVSLVALNQIRVVSLFVAGVHHPSLFHTLHVDVWQVVFVLAAVGCFGLWLAWSAWRIESGGRTDA